MVVFFMLVLLALSLDGTRGQSRGGSCTTENQEQGTCVPIRDCSPLRDLLQQVRAGVAPSGAVNILRSAICHFDNNEPLVCCSTSMPPRFIQPAPPQSSGESNSLLPDRCGITGLTDRIIDGEPARLRAWPWMVLMRGNTGGRSFWFCGGTLISSRYVLTAAHCFKPVLNVNMEFARIGEHNLRNEIDCEFGVCAPKPQDIPVAKEDIILHPQYERPCPECNDIALVRLSREAQLNPLHVTPICLPLNPQQDMGFSVPEFQGKLAWAAGWGTTSRDPSQNRRPSILQQVQLPIQELQYCQFLKKNYPDPSMVICAGGEGKDTCKGDSGGPLMITNTVATKNFLVGITSLGPTVCGSQNTQGLYTSVHHYIPWIRNNMRP